MSRARTDGWYWHVNGDMHARMYRLWTPTTGKQQLYLNGRTRVHHITRDALLAEGGWHKCEHPGASTFVSKRW